MKMTAYMTKLETIALAQNPQDAGPSEPPKRQCKITISYASTAKSGILKQPSFPKNKLADNNTIIQEQDTISQE
jgi:hypothetical protein